MADQQESFAGPQIEPGDTSRHMKTSSAVALSFLILGILSTTVGFLFARFTVVRTRTEAHSAARQVPTSFSPDQTPDLAKAEAEEISHLAPQQQAEHLLERAIHHQESSLNLIHQRADSWRGHLESTDQLFDLVREAMSSEDLRVRSAAVEIDLASSNLAKSPQSIAHLVQQIRQDPVERPLALWRLGSLGNRGVEPKIVLTHLLTYAHDSKEDTRYWAVEGLAMLGSSAAVNPLLDRFAHDPSARVRQRAALALGQDGMLSPEQRLAVVPDLFNLLDDDSLSLATRRLAYGTLRLITGAAIGNDTNAWLQWWAHHGATRKSHYSPKGLSLA
jgi:HEAT repeat protein